MGPRIIAISGKSGCGNTSVSKRLAERLGFRLVNYTFRNLAVDLGMAFDELLEKAEKDYSYDRQVDSHQVSLAQEGDCVVGSRLAIWMLKDLAVLRVFLSGGLDKRSERIWLREREHSGRDLPATVDFTSRRDRQDNVRYRRIYGIDNDDFSFADLVLNTERFGVEEEVDIIVSALRARSG